MNDVIKTATGKELSCDYFAVIPNPQQAYIRIVGLPLAEVATIFSNPNETVQLWYGEYYIANYTKLVALVPEATAVKVVLARDL